MSNCSFSFFVMTQKKFTRNPQEKIDLIYKTFFHLILENGYQNVSTNHIAKAAGISVGTVYLYFPGGKKDIINGYFEHLYTHGLYTTGNTFHHNHLIYLRIRGQYQHR